MAAFGGKLPFGATPASSYLDDVDQENELPASPTVFFRLSLASTRFLHFAFSLRTLERCQMPKTSRDLRAQAAHARYLADNMSNQEAQSDLRKIADDFDTEADDIEVGEAAKPVVPPSMET